jgi:hypothetical protein
MSFKEYYESAFKAQNPKIEAKNKRLFKLHVMQRLQVTEPTFYSWINGKMPSKLQQEELIRITGILNLFQ